jgi:ATP-dependent helicase HrpB
MPFAEPQGVPPQSTKSSRCFDVALNVCPCPLPIDAVIPALLDALRREASVVLRAPTGAGKTTRVPPAVLDAGIAGEGKVLVLQPRRVAARAAARRMAFERGQRLGETVGYHVRFDRQASAATQIVVMTEGVLLRMLLDDPFLEQTGTVIFDEFHERSLNSDMALGMVRELQQTVRPELKIVVMSATLAAQPIANYLGGCATVESEGRTFPVDVRYWRGFEKRPIDELAAAGVESLLDQTAGDMLVFLPGVGEIRRTEDQLRTLAKRHDLAVMPLYGDLSAEQQDAVLGPCPRRKVVLATNVAETSLTIDGITAVVDTGVARILRFDPRVGLDRLELLPISQASADQRAGRAGRTQPGVCLRLWDQTTHRQRPEQEEPEIRRVDLAGPILQLRCWGERDVSAFAWFEPPRPEAVEQATALLARLDAIDETGVTELGGAIARLPVHPRIGRLLVEGQRRGCTAQAALAAALLSERDPFERGARGRVEQRGSMSTKLAYHSQSDVLDRVTALVEFERTRRTQSDVGTLKAGAAANVLRVRDQLVTLLRDLEARHLAARDGENDEALLRALLAAFPDRLARRREPNSNKGVMVGGRGVSLHPQCAVTQAELFVCVDVDAGRTDAIVRQASAVERDWLPDEHLRTADELFFHPTQKRVAARRRTYWEDLLLDETPTAVTDEQQAAELLANAALADWDRVFPANDEGASGFLMRVRCLAEWMPELQLPKFDADQLREVLRSLCATCRSFDELRKAPWLDYLKGQLTSQQLALVDREAPERLPVPSGNRIKIEYSQGKPPVLAVRIQEVFGLLETPRIAGGRVPVLLHLLGPNMRPQQVTDDLRSFWTNTYPQVRKDLRRRYPKHAWPEDPWTAPPQSRPKRR